MGRKAFSSASYGLLPNPYCLIPPLIFGVTSDKTLPYKALLA